jgi:hypothetical protein
MRIFLQAFADEIVKLGAFPQQSGADRSYDAATAKVMDSTQGQAAKVGLKTGQPLESAPVPKKPSPTPLTTPNSMVDYASKGS